MLEQEPLFSTVNIKLAFSYSPKILINKISARIRTGILYIIEGEYKYSYKGSSFTAKAGDMVYLPPDSVVYEYKVLSVGELTKTHQIEMDVMDAATGKPLKFSNHPLPVSSSDESTASKFESVIQNYKKTDLGSQLEVYSKVYDILSECAKKAKTEEVRLHNSKIAPAINYLNENYESHIRIKDLAALCALSESRFRKVFIAETGSSPVRYKNKLILNEACRLLSVGQFNITEISDMLGFYDVYAFSHFFYKEKGVSPSKFAASEKRTH